MIRAALVLCLLALLAGCGEVTYSIKPFTDAITGKTICCEALITDGQNVQSVDLVVTNKPDGTVDVLFSRKGANASAPIAATTAGVVATAGAVSQAAITAAKFAPP